MIPPHSTVRAHTGGGVPLAGAPSCLSSRRDWRASLSSFYLIFASFPHPFESACKQGEAMLASVNFVVGAELSLIEFVYAEF